SCAGSSSDQEIQPVDLGMTSTIAPYYSDGNLTLYQVNVPVPLPVRRPTQAELQSLGAAPAGTPYPRAPFLTDGDESLEVHYVVSNLDAAPHTIWMLIDPWNEFVRYNPGVTVVSDDETDPNFGYDLSFYVDGNSRVEGDLTSDDMEEVAIKLAAAENVISQAAAISTQAMAGNGTDPTTLVNHIFNPQNWSNTNDPLFTPWVPPVIAGLTGFDLGLRSVNAPANVAVEITIQIQDLNGNRLVAETSTDQIGIPPTVISPPEARF
ncbi:MAG TPA: hypothetical protein VEK07_13645, partial [Polyangiaceae bacterium]|nr:hypothetical protein [Polyangiaceae bacterium]